MAGGTEKRGLYGGERAHLDLVTKDVKEALSMRSASNHPAFLRYRMAISHTRQLLAAKGMTNRNDMVSMVAERCKVPHASPKTQESGVTKRFPRVATAIGQFIVDREINAGQGLLKYARAINDNTPDATDAERLKLFISPLKLLGIELDVLPTQTPTGEPVIHLAKPDKSVIVPLYPTPVELLVPTWTVTPYTPRYEWDVVAMTRSNK